MSDVPPLEVPQRKRSSLFRMLPANLLTGIDSILNTAKADTLKLKAEFNVVVARVEKVEDLLRRVVAEAKSGKLLDETVQEVKDHFGLKE